MKNSDFEFEMERVEHELARSQKGIQSASTHLWEAFEQWPDFVTNHFSKVATIVVDQASQDISGTVLGKGFNLELEAVAGAGTGHVEVILWVPTIHSNEKVELGRFLMSPHGDVLTAQNEQLLAWQDEYVSYKLLASILRKVAANPASL
ncbi:MULTISPECIES: hypothetical protein [Pseudomonas putida group]|uniref:hypothetical protein n=1 Tax=Pseudomonas putida group TaxID=136845 RepID=UPI00048BA9F6|nr:MULTISPECIES: hypothetical protein [Pseudomonas putida group]